MGVQFDYPPPKDTAQATAEWEVIGQDHCIERLDVSTRDTLEKLKNRGVTVPKSLEVRLWSSFRFKTATDSGNPTDSIR